MAITMKALARTGFLFVGKSAARFTDTTVRENMLDPKLQARSLIASEKYFSDSGYPLRLMTPMMDLASATEDFGGKVNYPDNASPEVARFAYQAAGGIDNIPNANFSSESDVGIHVVRMLRAHYGTGKPGNERLFANCILGPFSLAARLADETVLLAKTCEDPDQVLRLLVKATNYLIQQAQTTLDVCGKGTGVIVCEPTAGMLSGPFATMYSNTFVKMIMDAVTEKGGLPMYHNCGNSVPAFADTLNDIGASVIHIGNGTAQNRIFIANVAPAINSSIWISGNLDPIHFINKHEKGIFYQMTLNLLRSMGGSDNFIASCGCDLPFDARPENMLEFFRAIRDFYRDAA